MGVQFRVGYNDHRLVADFLAGNPSGVSALIVDAKHLQRHAPAIDAARDAGVEVRVETLTERLEFEGYASGGLDYADSYPFGPDQLGTLSARASFVERVAEPQLALDSRTMTAPHFFASDLHRLELNVELAKLTVHEYGSDFEVRAVCSVSRPLLAESNRARDVARRYAESGVRMVELRLSPLGKPDEGVQKIKSTFDILRAFREYDVPVVLGFQGVIGETAYAAGLVDGYSTGIGLNDRFDFAAVRSSQKQSAKERRGDGERPSRKRGAPRVLLPTAGVQVSKKVAEALFADRAIRARLACRLGDCADSINGPLRSPLRHYLHDRAHAISEIDRLPPGWRVAQQRDRLQRSIELCEAINSHFDGTSGMKKLETRMLESLRASLDQLLQWRRTA